MFGQVTYVDSTLGPLKVIFSSSYLVNWKLNFVVHDGVFTLACPVVGWNMLLKPFQYAVVNKSSRRIVTALLGCHLPKPVNKIK